jgi:SAM-dependent methyltransferase
MDSETAAAIDRPLTEQEAEVILGRAEYWHYPFELPSGRTVPGKPGADVRHHQRWDHFFQPLLQSYGGSLAGKRILDLGCCQGFWSFEAARSGAASCLGIDSSAAFIAEARALQTILRIDNCTFRHAHLEDEPWWLGIEPVDICLFLGLFYHLTDPITVLRRAMALTREVMVVDTQVWAQGAPPRAAADPPENAPALILIRRNANEPTTVRSDITSMLRTVPTVPALVALLEDGGFATKGVLQPQPPMPEDYMEGRRISIIARRDDRVAGDEGGQAVALRPARPTGRGRRILGHLNRSGNRDERG